MLIGKENLKCFAGIFNRLRYFDGLMLKKEDFDAEQHYSREKAKLHNRLHGEGVVWGLRLTSRDIPIDGKPVPKLYIEPGFAIDCAGNEILVRESHRVDLESKLRVLQRTLATIDDLPLLWVGITYCEYLSNPEPQHTVLGHDGEPQPSQFSRVKEGYQVQVFTDGELSDVHQAKAMRDVSPNSRHYTESLGLSEDCPIILGCIKNYWPRATSKPAESLASEQDRQTFPGNIETYPFPSELIDTTYAPPMVQYEWEHQKQRVLHITHQALDWIDLSDVINQPVDAATKWINDHDLQAGDSLEIKNIGNQPNLMTRIEKAISYVKKETTVDLIVDQYQYVLFALPRE